MDNLVTLQLCDSRIEAEILKGKLAVHGIKSLIMADDAGGTYAFLLHGGFSPVRLMVHEKDIKAAKKVFDSKN